MTVLNPNRYPNRNRTVRKNQSIGRVAGSGTITIWIGSVARLGTIYYTIPAPTQRVTPQQAAGNSAS